MGKIIVFLLLAFVVYALVKGAARRSRPLASAERPAEHMVVCEHCKVNLPRSEAIEDGRHFYCSEEHRRLGAG